KLLPRQQTGQQAHRGARVTDIDRARRRLQTVQADTVDGDAPMVRPFDNHAHVAECLQGGKAVLTFQEALHFSHTFSQGAEHDGTVGNGLVAGYTDTTMYAGTGADNEVDRLSLHGFHISPAGQNLAEMLARGSGSGEYAQQSVGITFINRRTQAA